MKDLNPGANIENGSAVQGTRRVLSRRRRMIYNAAGLVLTGVGILGIITPVLPTTIFFILASALFIRSSPRIHRWLNTNRLTGPYIEAYTAGQGLSRRRKLSTIAMLWVTLGISGWFVRDVLWLLLLLGGVGTGVTIHVATIRPRKKTADEQAGEQAGEQASEPSSRLESNPEV